jgi:hypothetical protein
VGQVRVGDEILIRTSGLNSSLFLKGMGFLFLRQKKTSEENLHLEITICDFKTTYLLP